MSQQTQEIPENPAVRAVWEDGGAQTVVPRCIYCNGMHWHGPEPELFDGTRERSHRVSHCSRHEWTDDAKITWEEDRGYYLTPMNDKKYWIVTGDLGTGEILVEMDA